MAQEHSRQLSTRSMLSIECAKNNKLVFSSDHANELTLAKAQQSDQLSLVKKEMGITFAEKMLAGILNEFSVFVQHDLTPITLAIYAKQILATYWYMKIDDIIMCLKNGINGDYGKTYGKFNYSVFAEWMSEYETERDNYYYDKHLEVKESSTTTESNKQAIYEQRRKSN